jgi:thiol-disulfide isomerase/thioredoxin
MKKIYTLICSLAMFGSAMAQNFSDNFDSYTANAYLAQTNTAWKTWTNKPGTTEDVRVSSAKAKSGNNSLYFNSSASSGGPSDILLPFGGELTSGTFNLSLQIFVDAGKKAYFNLQEKSVAGQGWSVDVNFDSLGKFNLVNTTAGTLLTGSYTPNVWNKIAFNIDLSSNTWDFLINDVSMGKFQNSYRQIASMNIYPTQNSSYFIDDVSYSYTAYTPTNLNAALTFIDKVAGKLVGQTAVPEIEVKNLGNTAVTALSLEVTYNGTTLTKNVSGLNLAKNASTKVLMDGSVSIVGGSNVLKATLKTVNGVADDNAADDSKELLINPMTTAPGKYVVVEEATGTWCTWCPRGAVFLRKMDEKYGKLFIGIAVHNNDPMMNDNYDNGLGTIISGYPSATVDRGADIDPSAMETDIVARLQVAPKGGIKSGAIYNVASRELKVSLTTKFNVPVSGNYKVAFVLVEDSVRGTGTGWDQVNAYAGGSRGEMGGFEKLPNPVPGSMMVYDHVGRIIYPNFKGLNNAYAATVNAGDSFTHNFTVGVDPTWKVEKLHVVGLLIDPSGRIDNGSNTKLNDAIANGFVNGIAVTSLLGVKMEAGGLVVYPNPSKDMFTLSGDGLKDAQVSVYTLDGKLVQTEIVEGVTATLDGSNWMPGVYVAVVKSEAGNFAVKIVRE